MSSEPSSRTERRLLSEFKFSDNASPEENIQAFLAHLSALDAQMAALLCQHLDILLPLPDEPQRKNRARAAFNREIAAALETCLASDPDARES